MRQYALDDTLRYTALISSDDIALDDTLQDIALFLVMLLLLMTRCRILH